MKEIPLTKGFVALVDDEDYEWLSQVKWCWSNGYATTRVKSKSFQKAFPTIAADTQQLSMHRLIMGNPPGKEVDHEDGQTLDNRKANLRTTDHFGNQKNSSSSVGVSRFKGVCWSKVCCAWQASIMADRVTHHLGYFEDEVTAAKIYDRAAFKLHREYARFNFPDDIQCCIPYVFIPGVKAKSGYREVTSSGSKFCSRVLIGKTVTHLGSFETAYDAAFYREYYIEKYNLLSRMNF